MSASRLIFSIESYQEAFLSVKPKEELRDCIANGREEGEALFVLIQMQFLATSIANSENAT